MADAGLAAGVADGHVARRQPSLAKNRADAPGSHRTAAAFSVENVSYRAPSGAGLLASVSLDIPAGERLAIIGPNGAGKSTLLKLLCGRLRPSGGGIFLDGVDLHRLRARLRAQRIAVMAQCDRPDERLRAWDYVALGRVPHGGEASRDRDDAAVRQALETVGAAALAEAPIGRLSGGERQRLALARALAQKPAALLLDEPTNNLDPRARADLMAAVSSLGVTVVSVLHDLPLAADFADRVAVMSRGRIVCVGPPDAALSSAVIRPVFDLSVVRMRHPQDGRRPIFLFDVPSPSSN